MSITSPTTLLWPWLLGCLHCGRLGGPNFTGNDTHATLHHSLHALFSFSLNRSPSVFTLFSSTLSFPTLAFIFFPSQSCRRRGSGSPSLPSPLRPLCLFFLSEWTRQTKYCQTKPVGAGRKGGCPAPRPRGRRTRFYWCWFNWQLSGSLRPSEHTFAMQWTETKSCMHLYLRHYFERSLNKLVVTVLKYIS